MLSYYQEGTVSTSTYFIISFTKLRNPPFTTTRTQPTLVCSEISFMEIFNTPITGHETPFPSIYSKMKFINLFKLFITENEAFLLQYIPYTGV